jgi:L-fuconolactonase
MDRREVLKLVLGCAVCATAEAGSTVPIIDTHIHLSDPTRTGGVPWPPQDDAVIFKSALPSRLGKCHTLDER